jgi:hypothetical protein
MVIVLGKLEDPMQVFPAGTVHKYSTPGITLARIAGSVTLLIIKFFRFSRLTFTTIPPLN